MLDTNTSQNKQIFTIDLLRKIFEKIKNNNAHIYENKLNLFLQLFKKNIFEKLRTCGIQLYYLYIVN